MGKSDSNSNKDLEYDVFIMERKFLWEAIYKTSHLLDRSILALSAGAFGLSLAFLRQIAPTPKSGTLIFLKSSWSCFGASIIFTLISFYTSQSACKKQIEILEKKTLHKQIRQDKNWMRILTKILNFFSIIAFIGGGFLLAYFAIINLYDKGGYCV